MIFSLIVPVYNRPEEVRALLSSLAEQTDRGFECIIVEDGSTVPCDRQCEEYKDSFPLKYYYKENEGRSIARNYGIDRADGDYMVFVDSDCILPPDYFKTLRIELASSHADCYGGPDSAHRSFTALQKAINFAMTSFLTTGGIRGGKLRMEKFVPRTFNMGFSREVYDKVGGFREMFSEDIDMSTRIRLAGYSPVLFRDVKVFHKRRVSLRKFWRQVHVFGMSRITLRLLYPGSMKLVHWLPALFVIASTVMIACLVVGLCIKSLGLILAIAPLVIYILALFVVAALETRSLKIAALSVITSMIQLWGYGTGFIRAYFWKILLRHGRDERQEIAFRKGK